MWPALYPTPSKKAIAFALNFSEVYSYYMIRMLRGPVRSHTEQGIVIDVGGVGYFVATALPATTFPLDEEVTLHTHLAVRETALDLFGFRTRDELDLFALLLTVPKIGPKSALQVMTQADMHTIKKAVIEHDPSYLTKVSGIGKKTAEKIVTELTDKFDGYSESATGQTSDSADAPFIADTIDALVALGYPQADARKAVQKLPKDVTTANEAVRAALQQLGQM